MIVQLQLARFAGRALASRRGSPDAASVIVGRATARLQEIEKQYLALFKVRHR